MKVLAGLFLLLATANAQGRGPGGPGGNNTGGGPGGNNQGGSRGPGGPGRPSGQGFDQIDFCSAITNALECSNADGCNWGTMYGNGGRRPQGGNMGPGGNNQGPGNNQGGGRGPGGGNNGRRLQGGGRGPGGNNNMGGGNNNMGGGPGGNNNQGGNRGPGGNNQGGPGGNNQGGNNQPGCRSACYDITSSQMCGQTAGCAVLQQGGQGGPGGNQGGPGGNNQGGPGGNNQGGGRGPGNNGRRLQGGGRGNNMGGGNNNMGGGPGGNNNQGGNRGPGGNNNQGGPGGNNQGGNRRPGGPGGNRTPQVTSYRSYTCTQPNVIDVAFYDDAACTQTSTQNTPIMATYERGACVPLPKRQGGPGQGPGSGRGPGGRGPGGPGGNQGPGGNNQGGGGGRGPGGNNQGGGGGRGPGNNGRRLQTGQRQRGPGVGMDGAGANCATTVGNQQTQFTSVQAALQQLTCQNANSTAVAQNDPCVGQNRRTCGQNAECQLQNNVCVWTNAPQGQQNLFVVYDWKFVTSNGVETTDTYCFNDGATAQITTVAEHEQLINGLLLSGDIYDKKTCQNYGGKGKTKGNGKFVCKGNNKKLKCKKLSVAACAQFDTVGCVIKGKGKAKCSGGTVKLP